MKVLVQRNREGAYASRTGAWTQDLPEALTFSGLAQACRFVGRRGLYEAMLHLISDTEIISAPGRTIPVAFEDSAFDVEICVLHRKASC